MADAKITDLSAATAPVDADLGVIVQDVSGTPVTKKVTWTTVKAFLKTYFDSLYLISGGALGTPSSATLTNATGLPIAGLVASTSTALGVGSIELGHATANTLTASGGVLSVEGVVVDTISAANTLTNKTLTAPVLGGATTFASDASIRLTAAPADGHYSGITIAGDLGETCAFGNLVYLKAADSQWYKADADAAATAGVMVGMCVLAGNDNDPSVILLHGTIQAASLFPTLTIGGQIFAGETTGEVQNAIPTGANNVIKVVGFGLTGDILYFNPSQNHQITVA